MTGAVCAAAGITFMNPDSRLTALPQEMAPPCRVIFHHPLHWLYLMRVHRL